MQRHFRSYISFAAKLALHLTKSGIVVLAEARRTVEYVYTTVTFFMRKSYFILH